MHLTRIKMKDGKEYIGIIWNVEDGLRKDPPYITLRTYEKDIDVPLFEIISAITEKERVGVRKGEDGRMYTIIQDVDNLPRWLELYAKYKNEKEKKEKN